MKKTSVKQAKYRNRKKVTIGLDLGDRKHSYCVLDSRGQVIEEEKISNERSELQRLAKTYPGALMVMEAGMHSPWVSRFLEQQGAEVMVANPRKVRAISASERKSDRRDAHMLARLARADRKLLYPIQHGSEEAQQDLLQIKLRDSLVRARVSLINSVRFSLKSLGYRVSNPSSARFHKLAFHDLPEEICQWIRPTVEAIAQLSERIKQLDQSIQEMMEEAYPESFYLHQIHGIGPITSLYFLLKIEDPRRFGKTRDIGAFIGLCPKRDQSGEVDKELGISKGGDRYLRRLLVSAAQYILGPFGQDSQLRDYGLRLAQAGTLKAKKKAVVAVARKLAVLLLSLWKHKRIYEPWPQAA